MKKGTYQPKRKSRKRQHGFLARMASKAGRRIISARRRRGRRVLAH